MKEFDNHEFVSFFYDKKIGLCGFIAIHNTNLGPAAGGTRYFAYKSETEALDDALRLSRAMTYKCALAGVPYGGGKAVIVASKSGQKSKEFLKAYAKKVNLLKGNFYTGEDVGMTQRDINILAKSSPYIIGEKAGDLGPWTALGMFYALKAGLKTVFGTDIVEGRTFAVKGLGKIGLEFSKLIYKNGGQIIVADINLGSVKNAKKKFPKINIVSSSEIHRQKVDVYSPCAMGGEFNKKNIRELKCKIICGGANNQLASGEDGKTIYQKGILYIPDYLANSGGLINIVGELDKGGYSQHRVEKKIKEIQKTAEKIINLSNKKNEPTNFIADRLAEQIFKIH